MLASFDQFLRPPAAIDADGRVEGYASLFGEIDQAGDMVMPGAFADSLRRRGVRRVPMLFQHDPSEPIGVWLELREDARGLYARGRLIPEVMRARELIALLKAGAADGLSIGFRTVRGRLDPKTRIRKLDQIDLWEISIVTFPLLPTARLALASGASGQREQPHKGAAPDARSVSLRSATRLALASGASGQREQPHKGAAPDARSVSLRSATRPRAVKETRSLSQRSPDAQARKAASGPPDASQAGDGAVRVARTHQGWPVDPSAARFTPERLFRKRPNAVHHFHNAVSQPTR